MQQRCTDALVILEDLLNLAWNSIQIIEIETIRVVDELQNSPTLGM